MKLNAKIISKNSIEITFKDMCYASPNINKAFP